MKLLPHQRRQSKEVKRTSSVLDDYANLLSRDSGFLSNHSGGEEASVATTLNESVSVHNSTNSNSSVVSSVASFERQEVALGALLGKGHFTKVYEITSIELFSSLSHSEDNNNNNNNNDPTRTLMSENARAGHYAMKRLRKKLLRRSRGEFTRAAAALVVEAQFLSRLNHPNILKLRGSALGGAASSFSTGDHDAYFLILDRVSETLAERIHATWAVQRSASGNSSSKIDEAALLYEKTQCALQLASALRYLHDRRIIFRDVKPANLGFSAFGSADKDQTQSLQLYDFGMARELPVALGLANELFHMTQSAGTKPYTAVEVGTSGLYNLKADVYSFAMVVYEMMAEQMPFAHYIVEGSKNKEHNKALISNREFVQAVYIDGERPVFDTAAAPAPPQDIQDLLTDCWDADLFQRPTMDQVFVRLQDALHLMPGSNNLDLTAIPPKPQVPLVVMEAQQQQQQQATAQRKLGGSITEMSDISNRE